VLPKHLLRLWLFTSVFVIALLGCGFVQRMGALTPGSQPIQFVGKGETDQIWEASLRSNVVYELSVVPVTAEHYTVTIEICSRSGDICPEDYVLASTSSLRSGAALTFSINQNHQVYIHVFAGLGEGGEETGAFLIELKEVGQ
jgi:hypothetical protein